MHLASVMHVVLFARCSRGMRSLLSPQASEEEHDLREDIEKLLNLGIAGGYIDEDLRRHIEKSNMDKFEDRLISTMLQLEENQDPLAFSAQDLDDELVTFLEEIQASHSLNAMFSTEDLKDSFMRCINQNLQVQDQGVPAP